MSGLLIFTQQSSRRSQPPCGFVSLTSACSSGTQKTFVVLLRRWFGCVGHRAEDCLEVGASPLAQAWLAAPPAPRLAVPTTDVAALSARLSSLFPQASPTAVRLDPDLSASRQGEMSYEENLHAAAAAVSASSLSAAVVSSASSAAPSVAVAVPPQSQSSTAVLAIDLSAIFTKTNIHGTQVLWDDPGPTGWSSSGATSDVDKMMVLSCPALRVRQAKELELSCPTLRVRQAKELEVGFKTMELGRGAFYHGVALVMQPANLSPSLSELSRDGSAPVLDVSCMTAEERTKVTLLDVATHFLPVVDLCRFGFVRASVWADRADATPHDSYVGRAPPSSNCE
ncbi:hypothetical protein KSP40_PGU006001 [Platanthera guangdongensis]|uniref:Uncharacterized protein n=1 Tax=Platanthera guangdongensis TaxID=2320717 RepID=A0ABR2M0T8_9ASPA